MLIDAHAHVDRFEMVGEGVLNAALAEIQEYQILTISNSMDVPSYKKNQAISKVCNWVFPIFGIHPWNASEYVDRLDSLDALITRSPMIGEIGLDFFYIEDESEYPNQILVFEYLLSAAEDQNKIVHVHTKGAESAVYEVLQRYSHPKILIHWYSGPIAILRKFVDRGAYFTVGIEVKYSEHIRKIAGFIPLDQLLTETDNPGGPRAFLGESGMPLLLKEVIKSLAHIKGVKEKNIVQRVRSNLLDLIGDDPRLEGMKKQLETNECDIKTGRFPNALT